MKTWLSLLILFFYFSAHVAAQHHINRFKNKERQGLWITYSDSAKTQINDRGRYRKGLQKGLWKYYYPSGPLMRQDRYVFRTSFSKLYYPNGKLQSKGKSKLIVSEKLIHYFYYGKWLQYDTLGELARVEWYNSGKMISEKIYKTTSTSHLNDSLVDVLRKMDKDISKYSDSLAIAQKNYGTKSVQYRHLVSLNNANAEEILNQLDRMFTKYGYPSKALVGEQNTIPFSIISYADLSYKVKYYKLITEAADSGKLDWSSVAFFVDKVKVAQKLPQIYGTQYKTIDKKEKYYPIGDKPNLNERRKKVKLEEMYLSETDDSAAY